MKSIDPSPGEVKTTKQSFVTFLITEKTSFVLYTHTIGKNIIFTYIRTLYHVVAYS